MFHATHGLTANIMHLKPSTCEGSRDRQRTAMTHCACRVHFRCSWKLCYAAGCTCMLQDSRALSSTNTSARCGADARGPGLTKTCATGLGSTHLLPFAASRRWWKISWASFSRAEQSCSLSPGRNFTLHPGFEAAATRRRVS